MVTFRELPCPICASHYSEQKAVVFEKGYVYRRCPNCALVFINPQPDHEFMRERINEFEHQDLEFTKTVFEKPRISFFEKEVTYIKKFKPEGRLIDIGCGGGGFLEIARNAGYEVSGIEPNANVVSPLINKYGFDIFCGTLEEAFDRGAIKPDSYDIITLLDTLEHVPNPREILSLVTKALKCGGLAVMRVPNVKYFLLKYKLLSPFLGERINYLDPDYHIYYFNEKNLSFLIETHCGLEVLDIVFTESSSPTGSLFKRIAKFVQRGVLNATHIFNYNLKTCFTVYARKK